jgi:hypothetical protein
MFDSGRLIAGIRRRRAPATPFGGVVVTSRHASQDHSFDANDGEVVNFRTHGAMVWPRYVASIVKPDLAISLKRE